MDETSASAPQFPTQEARPKTRLVRAFLDFAGSRVIQWMDRAHELIAFVLIATGVTVTKLNIAPRVIRPLVRARDRRGH